MQVKKSVYTIIYFGVISLLIFNMVACSNQDNPLKKYGVDVRWEYGGATSSYPRIIVWVDYRGKKIDCPNIFGGIKDPVLKFKDMDGDGIEEIIFGNKTSSQIVSFKPPTKISPPRFIVIKN